MIQYPYIPSDRTIQYVPRDNQFMALAKKVCHEQSNERNHPTGSVVVKDGKVIGMGANRSALSNPTAIALHKKLCIRKMLHVKTGERYWLCPGCASPESHSEPHAIADAHAKGNDTKDADLYLWGHWWCCESCWNSMIKAGIKNVYLLEGSERLFDKNNPENVLGRQFEAA